MSCIIYFDKLEPMGFEMCLSLFLTLSFSFANAIDWNGNNWANGCDFDNHDLSNAQIPGAECGQKCVDTDGCTHFTWTTYNGGTCWMKTGSVTKADAVATNDQSYVCGITGTAEVLTTYHGANEAGACKLPAQGSYSVMYAVALGDLPTLGSLKYTNSMCGHILTVNCGNGDVDIIVMNSNLGGGLDLYGSTWNRYTTAPRRTCVYASHAVRFDMLTNNFMIYIYMHAFIT